MPDPAASCASRSSIPVLLPALLCVLCASALLLFRTLPRYLHPMPATPRRRFSLEGRLVLLTAIPVFIAVTVAVLLSRWLDSGWLEWAIAIGVSIPLVIVSVRWWVAPILSLFRA